jgi:hypothetical protein
MLSIRREDGTLTRRRRATGRQKPKEKPQLKLAKDSKNFNKITGIDTHFIMDRVSWKQGQGIGSVSVPPFDPIIVKVGLCFEVFEGLACHVLVKLEAHNFFQIGIFENLVQQHGLSTSKVDGRSYRLHITCREMDKTFVVMRLITLTDL